MKNIIKESIAKKILYAFIIAIIGFILLNITFMAYFLFQSIIRFFFRLVINIDYNSNYYWYPPLLHLLFVIVISLISWYIFHLKIKNISKAIFFCVPLATVYVTLGIFFYKLPIITYLLSGLFFISTYYYLIKTKKSWFYYYTLILVSFAMLLVGLLGVEI
ncbi:hypothetical protein J4471_06005 [Candidatus Woesearchaeota archaeon]|nr:hypothetical protein [Candidatus Woesearchaeota archaeon]